MVKKRWIFLVGIVVILAIALLLFFKYHGGTESFSVNTILLKISIPIGGESASKIRVTSNEVSDQKFDVYFSNLKGVASVSPTVFSLGYGESKDVSLTFNDPGKGVGVYSGELVFQTDSFIKKIPVILAVNEVESDFVITQETVPEYANAYPGGKFGMNIKIFSLRDVRPHDVSIKYSIKNLQDELILSEEDEIVVKENLGITKLVDLPKTLPNGNYVFISSIDSNGSMVSSGQLFTVENKQQTLFSSDLRFFVAAIIIFVLGIMGLFVYFIKTRDDLLLTLKSQQSLELKRNTELIKHLEDEVRRNEGVPKGKQHIRQLKEAKKKIIGEIKKKQRKQRREIKRLRKKGKKSEIKQKLDLWKKQGYKMFETEKEVKKISDKSIKDHVSDWKKQGYDVSFLNK